MFERVIAPENLFAAWDEFKKGKSKRSDVLAFEKHLERNIFALHRDLKNETYRHAPYTSFWIQDPKRRHIHKASVRDRILHHALFRVVNPLFEPTFIPNSFSCRVGKGTHAGVREVARMLRAENHNNTRACWVLKCDVRKFFDSVDHDVLLEILSRRISDPSAMRLLTEVVESYKSGATERERVKARSASAFLSAI